jgi:hypothetical protein
MAATGSNMLSLPLLYQVMKSENENITICLINLFQLDTEVTKLTICSPSFLIVCTVDIIIIR